MGEVLGGGEVRNEERIGKRASLYSFHFPHHPTPNTLLFIFLLVFLFLASLFQSANPFDQKLIKVTIPKGASTYAIEEILENARVIRDNSSFASVAKLFKFSGSFQAGQYQFKPADSLISILWKLKNGEIVESVAKRIKVTFPEGTSIYKMSKLLIEKDVKNGEKFKTLIDNGIKEDLRERHWGIFKYIPSESLEGYLYPDTYWFFEDSTIEDMSEVMLARFEELVVPFWAEAIDDTQFTLHEIITLASIIEKEAQKEEERKIISSVFHNRLKVNMPLAADPTIKYALQRPTKKVYHDQLSIDSPYNTYKRKGLPPGPICNPGIESIKAAVYPAKTNYYFFVAAKDGSHIFTRNWEEHQRARVKVTR